MDANAIFERTKDAHSFCRYGKAQWMACIILLSERGYNERQIEAILRSKWMRWAADSADGRVPTAAHLAWTLDDPRDKKLLHDFTDD